MPANVDLAYFEGRLDARLGPSSELFQMLV